MANQGAQIHSPRLRVVSIDRGGQGYELTDRISGLRFSNVAPGGDESASFTLHAPWRAATPEVARLNLLRVSAGLDVLWQGRVEEADRQGERSEEVEVTAYGLGARLRDEREAFLFCDRDLERWRGPSRARRIVILELEQTPFDPSVEPDSTNGLAALRLEFTGPLAAAGRCEAWYEAPETVSAIYWDRTSHSSTPTQPSSTRGFFVGVGDTDDGEPAEQTPDQHTSTADSEADYFEPTIARKFVQLLWEGTVINEGEAHTSMIRKLTVYGDHGLARQGDDPGGFLATQMISHVVGRVSGVSIRRLDATPFVVTQAAFYDPVTHADAVSALHTYHPHERTFGVWGPESALDPSDDGQFDYTALERDTQHWLAHRSDADDLDLHSETASLFSEVVVTYTDPSGDPQRVTRTRTVDELGSQTRTATIDGGTLTEASAQTLGDAFLALFGGFAPARGSFTVSRPIRHHERGPLPPVYLRADGSNLRVPDVLPSTTLFELDSDPDRRTTFPIKRVEVDASGALPRVTCELDQSSDALSALQAQLALAARFAGGGGGGGGAGGRGSGSITLGGAPPWWSGGILR